jgi:hypothetical protein
LQPLDGADKYWQWLGTNIKDSVKDIKIVQKKQHAFLCDISTELDA